MSNYNANCIRPINILVAGLSQRNVDLVKESFEQKGYQIIPANEISLSLFLTQKNFPDLIICDLDFKQGDGRSFLAELQTDPELEDIPFVFLIDPDRHCIEDTDAIASGAWQVLRHPITSIELALRTEPLIAHRNKTKLERAEQTPE